MRIFVTYTYNYDSQQRFNSTLLDIPYRTISTTAISYIIRTLCTKDALPSLQIISMMPVKKEASCHRIDKLQSLAARNFAKLLVAVSGKFENDADNRIASNLREIFDTSESYEMAVNRTYVYLQDEE